uniref:Zinc finger PHD-type domain-containing protein n=1 Tax=Timema bartmani TaxID=61472 RepID=A0A7R9I625_9NEOP|nr:unnamed protein product [Timema bartmani]
MAPVTTLDRWEALSPVPVQPEGSTSQCSPKFRDLIPIPAKGTRKPSTRKVAHSIIFTDSHHKNSVENAKKNVLSLPEKRAIKSSNSSSAKKSRDVEDAECIFCEDLFSTTGADWVQCQACKKWTHVKCSGVCKRQMRYICDFCLDQQNRPIKTEIEYQ